MLRRLLSPRPFEQTRQWNPPVNLPGCSCDFMSTYRGSCGLTTGPVVNYMFAKLMRSYGEDGDQQRKKLSTVGLNQNDQVSQKDQKDQPLFPKVCTCHLETSPILPMPGSGKGLRRFVEEIGHGVSASGSMGAFEI